MCKETLRMQLTSFFNIWKKTGCFTKICPNTATFPWNKIKFRYYHVTMYNAFYFRRHSSSRAPHENCYSVLCAARKQTEFH